MLDDPAFLFSTIDDICDRRIALREDAGSAPHALSRPLDGDRPLRGVLPEPLRDSRSVAAADSAAPVRSPRCRRILSVRRSAGRVNSSGASLDGPSDSFLEQRTSS